MHDCRHDLRPRSHVAVVTSSYPRNEGDPAGHFVRSEASELASLGHRVTVFAPGSSAATSADGVAVVRIPDLGLFGWPGASQRLRAHPHRAAGLPLFLALCHRKLLARGPFDRVIAHWIVPCAWPLAWQLPYPLEVVAHGSDVRLLLSLPHALREWVLSRLVGRGAHFRFVSHELRAALLNHSRLPLARRSSVRPCAIEVSGAPSRAEARDMLGIPSGTRVAAVVGRLIAGKRIPTALGAATLLPRTLTVVIGEGPERHALERRFPDTLFLGHLPRRPTLTWIAAADLVISASRSEGAPTVVREARALNVPVVAVPCGDLPRWATEDPGLWLTSVPTTLPAR